jgi:hypothetical protein
MDDLPFSVLYNDRVTAGCKMENEKDRPAFPTLLGVKNSPLTPTVQPQVNFSLCYRNVLII